MNRSLLIPSGTCSITLPFLHTQNLFSKNWALLLKHTKCWSLRDLFSLLSPVDATPFFSFYFTKHFIPSCSLLHTALFLHKITEEKKKTISQKVSCDAIRNVQEVLVFQTCLSPCWPKTSCQLPQLSDDGDAPSLPGGMSHAVFTQSLGILSFRNFYCACKTAFFKGL